MAVGVTVNVLNAGFNTVKPQLHRTASPWHILLGVRVKNSVKTFNPVQAETGLLVKPTGHKRTEHAEQGKHGRPLTWDPQASAKPNQSFMDRQTSFKHAHTAYLSIK